MSLTILLSSYNGAAFLPAQLQSLHAQTDPDWTLLWRDDGSTDPSAALLRAVPRARELPQAPLGAAASYWMLLRAAPDGIVAFCDQDDVWLPDKLARGRAALATLPPDQPALYCAAQTLVDVDLHPVGASPPVRRPPVFPMPLAQNIATGCTIMLNPPAPALLRQTTPPPGSLHDWWSALVISAAGGRILVDPQPVILYRQHAANLVGAPSTPIKRGRAALRRGPDAFMSLFATHVAALRDHAAILTPDAVAILDAIAASIRAGPFSRLRVLQRSQLRRQGRLETALFGLWFLRGVRTGPVRPQPR